MKVSGTNITAGTYVASKQSNTSLTLSTGATGAGAGLTMTFYQETGDNTIVTGGTLGYIRAFSQTFPVLLHMKPSAFPGYDIPNKSNVYFTVSSPGAASSGISLAPNAWVAGNRRLPHSSPRQLHARSCTGIVDIEGAAIVAFSDGIHMFANQRGANTGEDEDYRLFTVNDTRGCISYLGLVSGNGWAAYPTPEGVVITDKNRREFVISADIYNASDNSGDLASELVRSAASVASDSDDQHFSMAVMGSKLVAGVRISGEGSNARYLTYDFSPGVEASGVEELLNPDTKRSYIWSPPAIYNANLTNTLTVPGAMGSIRNASGRIDYIAYDVNSGNNAGRIDRINTGTVDNGGTKHVSYAIPAPWTAPEFSVMSAQDIEIIHRATGTAASGSASLAFAKNQSPTFETGSPQVRALSRSGDGFTAATAIMFIKQIVPIDQSQRVNTQLFWARYQSDAIPTSGVVDRVYRMVLRYALLDAVPESQNY
jgi:hypothetical protein